MKITNLKSIISLVVIIALVSSTHCLQQEQEPISQQIRNFGTFVLQHVELISGSNSTAASTNGTAADATKTADKSTDDTKKTEDKPVDDAKKTEDKTADESKKTDDAAKRRHRQRQARKAHHHKKTKEEDADKKPADDAKKTEDKTADDAKKTEDKPADDAAKTADKPADAKKEAAPKVTGPVPFFKGQKIELPKYCKADQATSKLNKEELVSIAQDASKFVGAWNKASGEESPFNNLKDLDEKQFAAFYKEITTGLPDQAQTIKADEADAQSKELLISVLFGDDQRKSVSWLEFWIYMCSGGIKPSKDQYLKSTVKAAASNPAVKTEAKTEAKAEEPKAEEKKRLRRSHRH